MSQYKLIHADCLDAMTRAKPESVDAIVTDPPYGLAFMGKQWDHGVPGKPFWEAALRVAKPGAHLLAFGGTRTYHRLACAIEDAGWEIRDCIMWVYGSGFPKSLDVSKAIDKAGGGESVHVQARRSLACEIREKREAAGVSRSQLAEWFPQYTAVTANWERTDAGFRIPSEDAYSELVRRLGIADNWRELVRSEDLRRLVSEGGQDRRDDGTVIGLGHSGREWESATEAAKQWQGWGTALKPAYEPILLARKPFPTTVAANVLTHGTGGLNIDGCRVGAEGGTRWDGKASQPNDAGWENMRGHGIAELNAGRWPANFIHDGSDEVVSCFPDSKSCNSPSKARPEGTILGGARSQGAIYPGETGSAARFFYCAKASKKDRDEGLDAFNSKASSSMSGRRNPENAEWDTGNDVTSRFVTNRKNVHPTVKPTDLMRYLCRLITPPGGVILDPFMGSGSTGKGAVLEGFRFIGIEKEAEYLEIAKARIEFAVSEGKVK